MDYYQGVVLDYIRADRAVFVNPECCIQLVDKLNPDDSGPHWYCDAVAVDLRNEKVFLCEMTYERGSSKLLKRLRAWAEHWEGICAALVRDCKVKPNWAVRPWLFVPEDEKELLSLLAKVNAIKGSNGLPLFQPRITTLESIQPWKSREFHSWNHQDKDTKRPAYVPAEMCV